MPQTLHHGDRLSPAEAAHLLTRAAQGERLTHAPVKVEDAYRLAHLATLTEHQQHRDRIAQLSRLLSTFTSPSLLA